MANTLIIGASSGIGASLAKQLIAEGHQVFGTFNKTTGTSPLGFAKLQPLNVLEENPDFSFLPDFSLVPISHVRYHQPIPNQQTNNTCMSLMLRSPWYSDPTTMFYAHWSRFSKPRRT
jgi:GDP-D-mannose dehydratase